MFTLSPAEEFRLLRLFADRKVDWTSVREGVIRDKASCIVSRLTPDQRFEIAWHDQGVTELHGVKITPEIQHAAYWFDEK